jgi:hypothetical protein
MLRLKSHLTSTFQRIIIGDAVIFPTMDHCVLSAVYRVHSMTCVWKRLNVCRDGLYDMLCVVRVERKFSIFHRMSKDVVFCALTFLDRRNSTNLLSVLESNTPRYQTRDSKFLKFGFHCMNYEVHQLMSAAMCEFNEVIGLFDYILTRNQFINHPMLTL